MVTSVSDWGAELLMELITGWNILVLGTGNRAWPPVDLGHITSSLGDDAEEYSHHGKTQRDAQIKIPSHQIGDKLTFANSTYWGKI